MTDYERALQFVLRWEGGATGNPFDTAARNRFPREWIHTVQGITQNAFDTYRRQIGAARVPVRLITQGEIGAIYRGNYWRASGSDDLEWPACVALFDLAVHSGVGRAREAMAEARADGFSAVQPQMLAERLVDWRVNFFNAIIKRNPTQLVFKRGWFNRLRALKALIGYGL